jgi:hypothetical protein
MSFNAINNQSMHFEIRSRNGISNESFSSESVHSIDGKGYTPRIDHGFSDSYQDAYNEKVKNAYMRMVRDYYLFYNPQDSIQKPKISRKQYHKLVDSKGTYQELRRVISENDSYRRLERKSSPSGMHPAQYQRNQMVRVIPSHQRRDSSPSGMHSNQEISQPKVLHFVIPPAPPSSNSIECASPVEYTYLNLNGQMVRVIPIHQRRQKVQAGGPVLPQYPPNSDQSKLSPSEKNIEQIKSKPRTSSPAESHSLTARFKRLLGRKN